MVMLTCPVKHLIKMQPPYMYQCLSSDTLYEIHVFLGSKYIFTWY